MIRNIFAVYFIVTLSLWSIVTCGFAEEAPKGEQEKSELAKIMDEIDKNYKLVERISGYYKYSDNDWKDIAAASSNIIQLTKTVISKFPRPDDRKYQELNKTMLSETEKMLEVVKRKNEQGALEDAQWQVRRLRQTCAVCHKHLGIHLYPQLYPGKKNEALPGQEEMPPAPPVESEIPKW